MEPNIGEKPHFGGHLLIILSEPYTDNHRERILEKVSKGFFSWDVNRVGCDLTCLKDVFNSDSSSEQTEGFLIQYSTEALAVEVLLNPKVNILKRCIKNVLSSVTAHKHIIHAGYTFTESGSWILQDGVFSFQDFTDAFNDHGVQQVLTKIPESSVHVHCIAEGDWSEKNIAGITACVYLNPPEIMSSFPDCHDLLEYLKPFLISQPLEEIMKASDVVGNIRFSRPTLYIFPGGDGNCALFGIRGFNILIDGGFERKPSFWEFVRHIDTLDAMMVTRLNQTNLNGITSLIKRKQKEQIFPNIRYVFCNIMDEPQLSSGEFPKVKEDLLISVFDEIYELLNNLNKLNLKPHPCYRENGTCPLTLYHKMGHGTLDMHVLHPLKHTKGVKEFFEQWSSKKDSFTDTSHGEIPVPLSDLASICVLLVWRPANSKDSVTRILVTGNTPQTQIFEGLDKMQNLKILHNVDCSQTVLQKTVVDKSKHTKNVEKPVAKAPSKPNVSSSFAQQKKIAQKTHVAIGKKDGINMSKAMPEKSPICTDKVSAKKNTESKKLDTKFNGKTLEGKGDTLEKTGRPFNKVEIARRSDKC
ncbi:microtubule-associated protein futsch-like [Limulus polyphemus]|uniref:Microtubule-associated protein futsch-like n=1 Tax=Limulus polyphemus TaxID=6850 RepID=A0ABM1SKY0_LIMPO|nr:microtubule-associated protein futsch-like [Limulus polyphemus]